MSQELLPSIPRSNIYRLLSLGFRYPAPSVFKTFQNGEFLVELEENISHLPHLHAMEKSLFVNNLDGVTFSEFEEKFVRTFDTGSPLPPCPPYEGMYIEPRTGVMLEISEFYRCFGLAMSQKEGKREFPDHISAELEFLHFLTFKEAQAIINDDKEFLRGYLLAQKDFLEHHLTQWVPKFLDKLQNFARVSFYIRLAEITSMVITQDLEFVTAKLLEKDSVASQVAYKNKFL